MSRLQLTVLTVSVLSLLFVGQAKAFGAGEVANSNTFDGYFWRHGDFSHLLKLIPATYVTKKAFTEIQRRQVYFGNWLRDYSQFIDKTCLTYVDESVIRGVLTILAFMEFGLATGEFDLTRDKLGFYRHVEHIDNPKGYDPKAKDVDNRLRGVVLPIELEIDATTGMKNYIANSKKGWETATEHIETTLRTCIEEGRKWRRENNQDSEHKALRFLGSALHTIEDFSAHSNFIELCLLHLLKEEDVFPVVGLASQIPVPGKDGQKVYPLVTGTFGQEDIFHAILGEVDDKGAVMSKGQLGLIQGRDLVLEDLQPLLAQIRKIITCIPSQMSDINKKIQGAEDAIKSVIEIKKASDNERPAKRQRNDNGNNNGNINGNTNGNTNVIHNDVYVMWKILEPILDLHGVLIRFMVEHHGFFKIDALKPLNKKLEKLTDDLVYTVMKIFIEPSIQVVRDAIKATNKEISEHYKNDKEPSIFVDNSTNTDPSHTEIAKDHFSNVLNPCAGYLASLTSAYTIQEVVLCWDNENRDVDNAVKQICSVLHHPCFPKKKTDVQNYMSDAVQKWWEDICKEDDRKILREKLKKESIEKADHNHFGTELIHMRDYKTKFAKFPGFDPEKPDITKETKNFSQLPEDIKQFVDKVEKAIREGAGEVGRNVIEGSGTLIDEAKAAGDETRKIVVKAAEEVGGTIQRATETTVKAASDTLDEGRRQVGGVIKEKAEEVDKAVQDKAKQLQNFGNQTIQDTKNGFENFGNQAKNLMGGFLGL